MGKSYRGCAEIEDWSSGRALRRPSKRKSEIEWKKELAMAGKDDIYSVYVIINEWSPEDSREDLSEVVEGKWYASENEAWEALRDIADSLGYELDIDDISFDVHPSKMIGLVRDAYYIQELIR